MTIKEAEKQYYREVEKCREQHVIRVKKATNVGCVIGFIFIAIGLILLIIGFSLPPDIIWGYETDSAGATFCKIFGGIVLPVSGVAIILIAILCQRGSLKKGPTNFLPQIRNLYLNYLKCDDMSGDDKEFYKQKLEDIRNMELVNAIYSASIATNTAIMFNMLHRK